MTKRQKTMNPIDAAVATDRGQELLSLGTAELEWFDYYDTYADGRRVLKIEPVRQLVFLAVDHKWTNRKFLRHVREGMSVPSLRVFTGDDN